MTDSVRIALPKGESLLIAKSSDGGIEIEQTVMEIDGKRDHLVLRTSIAPVDAKRVFALLGDSTVRNSTGG